MDSEAVGAVSCEDAVSQRAGFVLETPELLALILRHLTRHEAAVLLLACKPLSTVVRALLARGECKGRLVVGSSGNSRLVEVDVDTGATIRSAQAGPTKVRAGKRRIALRDTDMWITGLTFSPYDHDLYVSQYRISGVEVYHGRTLQYRRIFCRHRWLTQPEGLAFHNDALFVAGVHHGFIVKLDLAGHVLQAISLENIHGRPDYTILQPSQAVPWGLTAGFHSGRDHLFVAIDFGFEVQKPLTYADAPKRGTGAIVEILQDGPGSGYTLSSHHGLGISRPSGVLAYSPRKGSSTWQENSYLYITTSHSPVLRIRYSEFLAGGNFEKLPKQSIWDESLPGSEKLWDVCIVNDRLVVSIHSGHVSNRCRLKVYTKDGRFLRAIGSSEFAEPNMFAVQY